MIWNRWWICRGSISTKPSVQGRLKLLADESLKQRGSDIYPQAKESTTNAHPFTNMPEQKRFLNLHRMLNTVVEKDLWEEEGLIRSLKDSSNSSSFSSIAQGWRVYFRDDAAWGLLLGQFKQWILSRVGPPGGTPLIYGLYGDLPLDRGWFFYLSASQVCPKQGIKFLASLS